MMFVLNVVRITRIKNMRNEVFDQRLIKSLIARASAMALEALTQLAFDESNDDFSPVEECCSMLNRRLTNQRSPSPRITYATMLLRKE